MSSQMTVNLLQGSVRFEFSPAAAAELKAALTELTQKLKAVAERAAQGDRTPAQSLEFQYTGPVFVEVFCNPNIWASPFAAKLLITVRDERIRITTEAELTRMIEDVNLYLEQAG